MAVEIKLTKEKFMSLPIIKDLTTEVIINLIKSGAFKKDSTWLSRNGELWTGYDVEYIDFEGDVNNVR